MLGVTGATGEIGRRVTRRLADREEKQRLIVRDPSRLEMLPGVEVVEFGGYGDEDGMRKGFTGVSTLFFCSAKESEDRVVQHRAVVDAAVVAGVERIVYLSFIGAGAQATFTFARDHYDTEQYIRSSGIPFTFSRQSLYTDVLPLLGGNEGVIRGPAGDGRIAPVLRDDVADVLVNVLVESGHDGVTYTLTGPEANTLSEIADLLTKLTGQCVTFENETLEQAYASRAAYGAQAWEVEGWVTTYTAIAAGECDVVTDDVRRVAGHDPISVQQFLESLN
jgi:NAD(P)H dehydrogenase (quinone)